MASQYDYQQQQAMMLQQQQAEAAAQQQAMLQQQQQQAAAAQQQQQQQSQPSVNSSPLFALLIPGRTLDTNFAQVDSNKMLIQVPQPISITELTVCMLQPSIPADSGVAVYYALPPFADWQYLGFINLQYPTASFRAIWRDKIPADTPVIGIGLAVEPMSVITALPPADAKEEERTLDSAKGIAKNLYEYMASFSQNTGQYKNLGDVLVIPTNCVDQWFSKFTHKHKLEPYFWMKTDLRPTKHNH
jgi:type II secretory pathway pseudopilin PulG